MESCLHPRPKKTVLCSQLRDAETFKVSKQDSVEKLRLKIKDDIGKFLQRVLPHVSCTLPEYKVRLQTPDATTHLHIPPYDCTRSCLAPNICTSHFLYLPPPPPPRSFCLLPKFLRDSTNLALTLLISIPSQFKRAPSGPLAISGPGLFQPTALILKVLICHQAE